MAGNASPTTEDVCAFAAGRIQDAAARLWPGDPVTLGPHTPSVTGYVQRIEADGRALFAKYSVLGALGGSLPTHRPHSE
ncbi:hypothetical protein [Streptomyces sp. H27-D2]|uniref:hypothetical protein n=1 Tax=Streptomyces sp. H27-D2 TaxID=3046304 RepID=UPI002DB60413|nr:hypothetical protein [Streptomyces sp. H27-D2]MEC4020029.1 hypothetical protein [Streptomyces sp. H27-D2]